MHGINKCKRCGRILRTTAKFCPYCGLPVSTIYARPRVVSRAEREKVIGLMMACLCILVFVAILLWRASSSGLFPGTEAFARKYSLSTLDAIDQRVTVGNPTIREATLSIVTDLPKREDSISETTKVEAGSYVTYSKYCRKNTKIEGFVYTAKDDFNFYLVDYLNYLRFQNGQSFYYYVGSERVREYSIDFTVPEDGEYYFILSNTYSWFTPKYITIQVRLTYTPSINVNSSAWKIWRINRWIEENIRYVSDPVGREYIAYATETYRARAGDCEDIAILIATMCETVGMDSAIGLVDTDGDTVADHAAALVYFEGTADEFLREEQRILNELGYESPTGTLIVKYFPSQALKGTMHTYPTGIWIFVDPLSSSVKGLVGYITHKPYNPIYVVNVGYR